MVVEIMEEKMSVLEVHDASCKDCHRCLRECSVKAIAFEDDQARIIEEKCIYCGKCVNVCPQDAKVPRNETELFNSYINSNNKVVVSLAPSFAAAFNLDSAYRIVGALKEAGVDIVAETSQAAEYIAREYSELIEGRFKALVSTCCPAVVNLVEKHYPELIPYLSPIISPMNLHAELLKRKYGEDIKVVFIGPCIAKIDEAERHKGNYKIDAVLTFDDLKDFFNKKSISPYDAKKTSFDEGCFSKASSYPLEKGAIKAAAIDKGFRSDEIISMSGVDNCIEILEDLKNGSINARFIELLACEGGCINGPAVNKEISRGKREQIIKQYTFKKINNVRNINKVSGCEETGNKQENNIDWNDLKFSRNELDLKRNYKNRKHIFAEPSEKEIKEILESIGKYSKEDETNCGGCGYDSCREKAVAVYQGLAKRKMCIPYMKSKAESLSDIIVESSHNAIIVVDKEMIIQEFNPVANEMFNKQDKSPVGQPLSRYIDPKLFKKVWNEKKGIKHHKISYEKYDIVTDQTIFPLEEYDVIVGIFTDHTKQQRQKEEMKKMKEMAADKAADVVHKQMEIVQEIAGLLGETTVETKSALYELTELIQEGE